MTILAVMVRYNTPLHQSDTLRGVCEAFVSNPAFKDAFQFLIWDNSPEVLTAPSLPIPFEYRHSRHNIGIAGAFNSATQIARERGHAWMLLLDQDTKVHAGFFDAMLRWTAELENRSYIALIAPTVRSGNLIVSPREYLFNRHRAYPDPTPGIATGEAFAINSGAVVRVAALRSIGGFSTDFWLDYSDIYVCHQFYLRDYKIWRATDAELDHEMSVRDYDRLMTPARYINYSYAETAFNDIYKGVLENWTQNLRLVARTIRQRRQYKNRAFSRITAAQLLYRLRTSREERIERWRLAGEERLAKMTLKDALDQRKAG
ncbi:MAG: hypothetical protein ACRD3F_15435 [Acidobacteriaceae bacterium]